MSKTHKMKRGGHAIYIGTANMYKKPLIRRISKFTVPREVKTLLKRIKAKAARIARKISRPSY